GDSVSFGDDLFKQGGRRQGIPDSGLPLLDVHLSPRRQSVAPTWLRSVFRWRPARQPGADIRVLETDHHSHYRRYLTTVSRGTSLGDVVIPRMDFRVG